MNAGPYQAAAALNAHSRWQEIIFENLAAASIPGYKKQELSFGALQAALAPGANPHPSFPRPTVATNFQASELKSAGERFRMNKQSSSHCEEIPNAQPSLPIWRRESRWNDLGIVLALCALVAFCVTARADSLWQEGNCAAIDQR